MWSKFKQWLIKILSDESSVVAKTSIQNNLTNTVNVESVMNPTFEQTMELKELIKKRKAALFNLESLNLRIESLIDDIERIEIE